MEPGRWQPCGAGQHTKGTAGKQLEEVKRARKTAEAAAAVGEKDAPRRERKTRHATQC